MAGSESSVSDKTTVHCEACKVTLHQNAWNNHVNGKKHKLQQDIYNKEHTTVFVTGKS